jgi:hypothetical protein
VYRKDDDKYNKPGNAASSRWSAVKNLLSLVGIIALIYVPVSMLLLPTSPSTVALVSGEPAASTVPLTTTTTTTMTSATTMAMATPAPPNPAMPEHHPADVRRIAEMQATIVRRERERGDVVVVVTHKTLCSQGSLDGCSATTKG